MRFVVTNTEGRNFLLNDLRQSFIVEHFICSLQTAKDLIKHNYAFLEVSLSQSGIREANHFFNMIFSNSPKEVFREPLKEGDRILELYNNKGDLAYKVWELDY